MTGIIERLRSAEQGDGYWPPILAKQAAAEIESLRAERDALRGALEEIKRLKPERVAEHFVTGPQALLDQAQRIARARLAQESDDGH